MKRVDDIPEDLRMVSLLSRRDVLKQALMTGALVPQIFGGRGGRRRSAPVDPSMIPAYSFRTLALSHFPGLQAEYDRSRNAGSLSRSKAFRDQIVPLNFKVPADFPGAKSVVVIAVYSKPMYVNFRLSGNSYRVMVPPQYYTDTLNSVTLKAVVEKDIVKKAGARIVDVTERIPLKLLAARSGLGRYARNNLIFVDGMGSYNLLYAFLTDQAFRDDGLTELDVLDRCRRCDHCDRICPTECILRSNFVINIDRCLTLYNENPGTFPSWIYAGAHHALMGCMKCQDPCPVNGGFAGLSGTLEDISEDETRKILNGMSDEALLKSLNRKLKNFPAAASQELFPVLTRNLKVLVRS